MGRRVLGSADIEHILRSRAGGMRRVRERLPVLAGASQAFGDDVAAHQEESVDRKISESRCPEQQGQKLARTFPVHHFRRVRHNHQSREKQTQRAEVVVTVDNSPSSRRLVVVATC